MMSYMTILRTIQNLFEVMCWLVQEHREGMGQTKVPGHAFLAWRSTWRMVMYIYYITAARNSISSHVGSSCQGNRYCTEKAGGTARPSRTISDLPVPGRYPPASQAGRRGGPPSLRPHCSGQHPEAESKEKHEGWDPLPEFTITSPFVDSRADSNTYTMGKPMSESTLTPRQSRLCPPVKRA